MSLECARCLEDAIAEVDGELDEEFVPSTDVRTGLPSPLPNDVEEDENLINEHHEIDLNEILRQNILTHLPLQPLCDAACPGLCQTCGDRLGQRHSPHTGLPQQEEQAAVNPASPFARLAVLLHTDEEN